MVNKDPRLSNRIWLTVIATIAITGLWSCDIYDRLYSTSTVEIVNELEVTIMFATFENTTGERNRYQIDLPPGSSTSLTRVQKAQYDVEISVASGEYETYEGLDLTETEYFTLRVQ